MRPNRCGFTFLEVLIALTLLAIVLAAAFRLHFQTLAMDENARFYTAAPLVAEDVIARVEMEKIQSPDTGSGDTDTGSPTDHWTYDVSDVSATDATQSAAARLKAIAVTVSDDAGRQYHLTTYRLVTP